MTKGKVEAQAAVEPYAVATASPGYKPDPLVGPTTLDGLRRWLADVDSLGVSGTAEVLGSLDVHPSGLTLPPPATTVAV